VRLADLAGLPPTLTTDETAVLLRVSTEHLWALARSGQAPVEPIRVGRRLRWPTAKVLGVLGIHAEDALAALDGLAGADESGSG
jgi:hypothetical protein